MSPIYAQAEKSGLSEDQEKKFGEIENKSKFLAINQY
jgi:hypothetical protein